MKKLISLVLALVMVLALAACGQSAAPAAPAATVDAATAAPADPGAAPAEEQSFVVGICQLVQHPALDQATQGFKDKLTELLGDRVSFVEQNASGDPATCSVICGQFVSDEVDLIMANATPALQAAVAATNEIPILATSITEYGVALGLELNAGTTGINVSGTSDLAPLDQQAQMIVDLFPEVKSVGMLFCSGEANSRYQVDEVGRMLTEKGLTVTEFSFADSNDVSSVTQTACSECELIYIPTDNTAASCVEAINNVALPAGIPVIAGEEGICAGCGVATLSISYYDIGAATAEMAFDILVNGADVSAMPIAYAPQFVKKFNPQICETLGVTIPDDYVAIE